MGSLNTSLKIEARPEEVFGVFTDLENAPRHIQGIKRIERLTSGPFGVGTRFRETRTMFRRDATEELEVTSFVPGKSYTVGCTSCGAEFKTRFEFTPAGSGTVVDVTFEVQPKSLVGKLMAPLGKMMMGSMKKCFDQDMNDLKTVLEAGRPTRV